eukprot:1159134-Pelagomonas_calceolata.AAC.3
MHRHTCLRSCMVAHHQPVCMTQASFEKCAINDLHVVETRSTPQLRVGWCSLSPTPHRATTTDDLMTRPLRSGPSICFIISCFSRLRQIAPARSVECNASSPNLSTAASNPGLLLALTGTPCQPLGPKRGSGSWRAVTADGWPKQLALVKYLSTYPLDLLKHLQLMVDFAESSFRVRALQTSWWTWLDLAIAGSDRGCRILRGAWT